MEAATKATTKAATKIKDFYFKISFILKIFTLKIPSISFDYPGSTKINNHDVILQNVYVQKNYKLCNFTEMSVRL